MAVGSSVSFCYRSDLARVEVHIVVRFLVAHIVVHFDVGLCFDLHVVALILGC